MSNLGPAYRCRSCDTLIGLYLDYTVSGVSGYCRRCWMSSAAKPPNRRARMKPWLVRLALYPVLLWLLAMDWLTARRGGDAVASDPKAMAKLKAVSRIREHRETPEGTRQQCPTTPTTNQPPRSTP